MSASQPNPLHRGRGKDLRGFSLGALGIAAIITISMTALTWSVDQDPRGGLLQVVMYWLSMPARIFVIFSGPEHSNHLDAGWIRFVICFLTSIQWLVLGAGIGLLVALVRRVIRKV